jgi:cytochrome c oxidase assembly protein subunit 15
LKIFSKIAFLATAATYILIFIGGLVRVSGAGLGCPDWPKCFGSWIPPFQASQLPAGFDPATFNFALAWIEYINRLVGVLVGLLIVLTAIYAIKYFKQYKSVLYASIAAAILVAIQGWYGSIVVKSELNPNTITIHFLLAIIIVSLLTYGWQKSQLIIYAKNEAESNYPENIKRQLQILWIAAIIQFVFGTQVRGKIEILIEKFPMAYGSDLIEKLGAIHYMHIALGIIILIITLQLLVSIIKRSQNPSVLVQQNTILLAVLVIAQILVGVSIVVFNIHPVLQVIHMWIAAIFVGSILIIYTSVTNSVKISAEDQEKIQGVSNEK